MIPILGIILAVSIQYLPISKKKKYFKILIYLIQGGF
jgi:hypothetical protein